MTIDFTSELGIKAKQMVEQSYFIWLTTVNSKGFPQPRPVWFVWHQDSFLIYSEPNAYKVQHIRTNPQVSLNFNTADSNGEDNVIVFSGNAKIDSSLPPVHLLPSYVSKYESEMVGLDGTTENFSKRYSIPILITPTSLRGW